MILQALVKYYEDLERQEKLPKQGWCQAKVSYGINLSTDGDIKNILWLKEERQAGKKQIWISQTMKVPAMLTRSSGVAANFLCDNSKYMLGIDKSGTGKRITECFEAAKEKHLKLLKNTSGEMAQAICAFFYKWNPEKAKENAAVLENWEEITDGGNLIFCMDKKYAQDRGMYSVYPVEYKKGKEKSTDADRLQLVAQVLCLEEMFSATIPEAALFYGETRRREVVEITEDLRNAVKDIFEEMGVGTLC